MKKNIINICIGAVLLILGIKLNEANKGASMQDQNIALYNNFCQNGIVTYAAIDSVIELKNLYQHTIRYAFNGKSFHQTITANREFKQGKLEISILKNAPDQYVIGNACKHLTYEVNNKKSVFWEYLGLLLLLYGILVILIKSIKIIVSLKGKYKQLSVFEKDNQRVIPDSIRKIVEYQLKTNKKIEFEIPAYGTFQIIDYNSKGDDFCNPNYILKEINEHIRRYFLPVLRYSKIIPFAVNNNYKFLFIEQGKQDIVLIDLDSVDIKPLVLQNKISQYIDLNRLELRNDKFYYNGLEKMEDIITENQYFFDIPDCIFEGKDYFEMYSKCFKLLEKTPDFSFLNLQESQENYILTLNIEGKSKEIKLRRFSDYLDSDNFIESLNEILSLLNYNHLKYYLLSPAICDLGVVLAEEQTYKRLLDNGYIELNEEDLKLNSDELNQVRKFDDLMREIDNIEFHLEIIKKDNDLKKDLLYDFFYKTNYEFDHYGITELKNRLGVQVKKAESGYDVYFAIKKL